MADSAYTVDPDNLLIWVDVETTGLDAALEVPLEIGVVLTDLEGEPLGMKSFLVLPAEWREYLNVAVPAVRTMHEESGLLKELDELDATSRYKGFIHVPAAIDGELCAWLDSLGIEPGVHPLCGSSINFDRAFLEKHFPNLNTFFHYRNIDVSTLRGLCSKLNPRLEQARPDNKGTHRVISDIEASVELYKFYLNNFLFVTYPEG